MSASPATGTLAQTSFTQCSVVRSLAGTLTVYGFSADMGLFVVRQSGYDRTKMGTSFAGDQTWGPVFQLDQRMARLYPDPSPRIPRADRGGLRTPEPLHLYVMDPKTSLCAGQADHAADGAKVRRSRPGRPRGCGIRYGRSAARNHPLVLRADSAIDLLVNADYHVVTSTTAAECVTNALGKLSPLRWRPR